MIFEKYGQGKVPVILVAGGPSLSRYMDSLGRLIQAEFLVIEYSQKGTFENPGEPDQLLIEAHVKDLHRIVESCSENVQPVLVGHSWGADLALVYSAMHPHAVKKVVVLGTAPLDELTGEEFGARIASRLTHLEREERARLAKEFEIVKSREERIRIKQRSFELATPAYYYNRGSLIKTPSIPWDSESFQHSIGSLWSLIDDGRVPALLEKIRVPVVALHGEDDPIPFARTFDLLKRSVSSLATKTYKKAGHFLWLEPHAKEAFIQDLIREIRD